MNLDPGLEIVGLAEDDFANRHVEVYHKELGKLQDLEEVLNGERTSGSIGHDGAISGAHKVRFVMELSDPKVAGSRDRIVFPKGVTRPFLTYCLMRAGLTR